MTEELKACPFCGGKKISYSTHQIGIAVGCDSCGAVCEIKGSKEQCAAAWNTRAQLPSQGGEAVVHQWGFGNAWMDTDEQGAANARCEGYETRTLYTHPADQVADSVGVSRELLEQLLRDVPETNLCARAIRALLAKSEVVKK